MIEILDARKTYRRGSREVPALDGVTLSITEGEFVAIIGPSGSGKSTLLHLAGGLDTPTSGRVTVAGLELASLRDDALTLFRRQTIGFVFQFFHLLPTLTVLENTAMPALLAGGRIQALRPRVEQLLERVGLGARMDHLPEELSGGEMQRVAIARALINDPPIILADEPTGNLDSVTGASVLELLRELGRGRTIVIVTHDEGVAALANRTVRLKDGKQV